MKITEGLANFIVGTSLDKVPVERVKRAKQAFLDTLGVMVAGSVSHEGRMVIEFVREMGGNSQATVAGSEFRTSIAEAAFANGVSAHALEYDDVCVMSGVHPSAVVLPPALALGEMLKASGKEVLLAYILGVEVIAKIGAGIKTGLVRRGWHNTGPLGSLGAAATSAKLLKLGIDETRMALGVAASQASGLRLHIGTMTKPLHAGNAARNGLEAAMLAKKGFTANRDILESSGGFCDVFAGKENCDLEKIKGLLDDTFEFVSPGVESKLYPSCSLGHAAVYGIMYLSQTENIHPDEVESIECGVGNMVPTVMTYHKPQRGIEARFSMEFAVAASLLYQKFGLEELTDKRVVDHKLREIMSKVRMYVHPNFEGRDLYYEPSTTFVTVKLKDNRKYSQWFTAKGTPENPLTKEELVTKYRECARLVLTDENIERSIKLVENIETLEDITKLMKTLTT